MAGHAGNFFTYAIGRQSAKGTAQTTPKFKLRVTGGVIVPQLQVLDLPETDSSIQRSRAVKVGLAIGGAVEGFIRSDEFSFLSYLHMGAVTTTGAGPYTHTITAATQLPYATIYNAFDSTALVDRLVDCKLTELSAQGGAGQALSYSAAFAGISWTGGETDPASPSPSSVEPLVYPNVTVTFGGVTTDIVESFSVRSVRVAQAVQGDTGMSPADVVTGRWSVDGRLRILFETDAIWRDWITDSPTGTAPSQAISTAALNILATRSSSDEVSWDVDAAEIRNVTLVPDAAGNPLFYEVEWSAKPDPVIANTLTIVAKNNTASLTS
jgi:hypothetical protein